LTDIYEELEILRNGVRECLDEVNDAMDRLDSIDGLDNSIVVEIDEIKNILTNIRDTLQLGVNAL